MMGLLYQWYLGSCSKEWSRAASMQLVYTIGCISTRTTTISPVQKQTKCSEKHVSPATLPNGKHGVCISESDWEDGCIGNALSNIMTYIMTQKTIDTLMALAPALVISMIGGLANYIYKTSKGEQFKLVKMIANIFLAGFLGYIVQALIPQNTQMF